MTQVNTQGIDQLLQELNSLSARAAGQPEPLPRTVHPSSAQR